MLQEINFVSFHSTNKFTSWVKSLVDIRVSIRTVVFSSWFVVWQCYNST